MLGRVKKAVKARVKREVKAVGKGAKNIGKHWLKGNKQTAKAVKSTASRTVEGHKRRAKSAKSVASKAKAYVHKKTAPRSK